MGYRRDEQKKPEIRTVDAFVGDLMYSEFVTGESNRGRRDADYRQILNILDGERTAPNYSWMSDIQIPEVAAHYLTRQAIDAQLFNTRDYADIYLEETGQEFLGAAEAQKELINRTLNQRHLSFPMKFLRNRAITDLNGNCVARCWWERKTINVPTGEYETVDAGDGLSAERGAPVMQEEVLHDRFNFDILDPDCVAWDATYAYSIQDKKWVTFYFDQPLTEIKRNAMFMGYDEECIEFLGSISPTTEDNDTRDDNEVYADTPDQDFRIYERHGIFPAIIKKTDNTGYPTRIEMGYDENGQVKEDAVFIETTMSVVDANGTWKVLRFQPQKYRTYQGEAYKPVIRSLAYMDPREDGGFSDSNFIADVQEGMSDMFNMAMDRAKLATIPTFKMSEQDAENNDDLEFGPGSTITSNNPDSIKEFQVRDVSTGAMTAYSILEAKGQGVAAMFPETQGGTGAASTTATAVIGSNIRTNIRMGLREKMSEFTFLTELYWMIGQMTGQFANATTQVHLMGEKRFQFDPDADFYLKPLTASLEPEHSKANKITNLNSIMQTMAAFQHPDTVKVVNSIISAVAELMGDDIRTRLQTFDESQPFIAEGGEQQPQPGMVGGATNQSGVPAGGTEEQLRGGR